MSEASEPHVAAIVSRIEGDESAPLTVFDADPDGTEYPHVVVYADAGIGSSDREAEIRVRRTISWQTTVVAESPEGCRQALDRMTSRLEDWIPAVAGRSCSVVDHESSQPVRKNPDLPDRELYIATDQWSFVSDPA